MSIVPFCDCYLWKLFVIIDFSVYVGVFFSCHQVAANFWKTFRVFKARMRRGLPLSAYVFPIQIRTMANLA